MTKTALDHPLPAGMRDLLPEETFVRRAIGRVFLERAELCGYEHVIPPVFEYAETIERGLGTLDPREIVRFVEPETGEVVALRPDVTPQIARLLATRLASRPGPYRVAYDASVLRRRSGSRARTHRQIAQVGAELVGAEGPTGDLELLVLAATALGEMGLDAFTLDLGHADVVRALLVDVPSELRDGVVETLAAKDGARLAQLLPLSLSPTIREALLALPELHGAPSILEQLPAALAEGPARAAIASLRELVVALQSSLTAHGVRGATLSVDLGEVRGHAYYTGPFFQLFAEGPGVPIGGGGRYDGLLARFGRPLPATGLAFDVDALGWALRASGSTLVRGNARYVIVAGEGAETFATDLRMTRIPAIVLPEAEATAYAGAWGYSAVVRVHGEGIHVDAVPGNAVSAVSASFPRKEALRRLAGGSSA